MENTSTLWPFPIQTNSFEESVTLFKEEVIGNKLLLLLCRHGSKRIEGASELSFEAVASLDNFLLNLISLFLRDTRAKRVSCQVTANSDTSGFNHGSIFLGEWRALKFGVIHITNVTSSFGMTMILLNNLVHHCSKGSVRVV